MKITRKGQFDEDGHYIGSNPFLQGVEKGYQKKMDKKAIVWTLVALGIMICLLVAAFAAINWVFGTTV